MKMTKAEIDKAIKRFNELLEIPYEYMTLEQMKEFDELVDVIKQIGKGDKGK